MATILGDVLYIPKSWDINPNPWYVSAEMDQARAWAIFRHDPLEPEEFNGGAQFQPY